MVTLLAAVALAAAVSCVPGPVAGARLAALWPTPSSGPRWRPWAAGPVVVGGVFGLVLAGPGGALAGALVAFTVRRRHRRARATSEAARIADQLASAVGRITDELRAGSHPAAALNGVHADGPHARELLAPAAVAAQLGDGVPPALRRSAAGRPDVAADLDRLASVWSLAERHGIPLADLLAGAQADIRWRVQFGNTVRSQLAGPRATAAVLTALPVLGLGLGQLIGADPVAVLRGGVLGQAMLVSGVVLAAAGTAWSDQILRAAVPR
ncbi:MAG: type II secretion system protein [Pseudonocardia sp.]|nr:type II secretion system protein [Pseudonocardia sp.]